MLRCFTKSSRRMVSTCTAFFSSPTNVLASIFWRWGESVQILPKEAQKQGETEDLEKIEAETFVFSEHRGDQPPSTSARYHRLGITCFCFFLSSFWGKSESLRHPGIPLLLLLFYSDSPEFCFLLLLNQAQLIIVLSAFFSISHSYSSAFVDLTITIYCFLLLSHKSINKHSLMTIFFIHNSRHQNL